MKPAFIVIEGIDGSGKTTLLQSVMEILAEKGIKALSFKEPGDDNAIGRAFREMSGQGQELPPLTSAFLLAAERYWRSKQVWRWLEEGYIVIADRYYLSGMVYCGAEGLSFERFSSIHQGILKPDLYIYLDIPLDSALQRKGNAGNRWEEKSILWKAASLYPEACEYIRRAEAADICVVDADQSISGVLQQSLLCISRKVSLNLES